jgi:hypothetical protein
MPDSVDPQAFLKLCEMSIDTMYELEALGALLEEKGFLHKQEILDRAKLLKGQTHQAIPSSPGVQPITDKENAVIEQIMEVILQSGLSSQQAKDLLERTIILLEWGEKAAPKTTH